MTEKEAMELMKEFPKHFITPKQVASLGFWTESDVYHKNVPFTLHRKSKWIRIAKTDVAKAIANSAERTL